MKQGNIIAISGTHGCFGYGTPIRMHDKTIKEVQEIELGDLVMGDNFTPRKVLRLVSGKEELFEFEYTDSTKHVYNKSHDLVLQYYQGDTTNIIIGVKDYLLLDESERKILYKVNKTISNKESSKIGIKKVTPLGIGNYYGFTLDKNNLFLHADGTVLKNCGKSTLVYSLAAHMKKKGKNVVVLNEIARECPFKINEEATNHTQIWLITKQINTELELSYTYDYVISDRSVIDPCAYAQTLNVFDVTLIYQFLYSYIQNYYKDIFVLDPESFSYNTVDGVRSNDYVFREKVHKSILRILNDIGINYKLVKNKQEIFMNC